MSKPVNRRISNRERLAVYLIVWAVKILAPWEYSHEFKDDILAILRLLKPESEVDE